MTTPLPPTSDGLRQSRRALLDWRIWGALAAALVVIYSALGLLRGDAPASSLAERPEVNYDAWSSGITSVLYDVDGNIEYTLEAERQVHYLDDSTELVSPNMRLQQDTGANWNITARSGRIHGAAQGGRIERLDLSDQVTVEQVTISGEQMTLNTSFLSIYPDSETMDTDQEVTLTTDSLLQTAIGMRGNLNQDTLTFLSQVRGRYETPAQP